MKSGEILYGGILLSTTVTSFLCSYFLEITAGNLEQYMGLVAVIFIDGFFGVIAGTKREGFQTRKALKVIQRGVVWVFFLTTILMVEKGFEGTFWLSETVLTPFLILQLISALKNASMAGFIKAEEFNKILDKIDKHKGTRR